MEPNNDNENQNTDVATYEANSQIGTNRANRKVSIGSYSIDATENDGTPNKCLARLVRRCIDLHSEITSNINPSPVLFVKNTNAKRITTDMIPVQNAEDLVDELESLSRSSLTEIHRTMISNIVNKALLAIKSRSAKEKLAKPDMLYIAELWYTLLIKSISDVAQFGSTIRNAHTLVPRQSFSPNGVVPPCFSYLSSDLIAAAEATTLGREVEHPYLILSSRKSSSITQTIILQKREIAATAIFMQCLFDEQDNRFLEILQNYNGQGFSEDENRIKGEVMLGIYKQLNLIGISVSEPNKGVIDNFKTTFIKLIRDKQDSLAGKYNIENGFMENMQKWADDAVNIKSANDKFVQGIRANYKRLIDTFVSQEYSYTHTSTSEAGDIEEKAYSFIGIIEIFEHMIMNGTSNTMFTIPRWIHQMATDIFSTMHPIGIDALDETKLDNLSLAEIIAATEDAAYGHDYKIDGITTLGEEFMNKVILKSDRVNREDADGIAFTPFNYIKNSSNEQKYSLEKRCIIDVLERNKYVTITQEMDYYVVMFNSEKNFLTIDTNSLPLHNTVTQWNIGVTPYYPYSNTVENINQLEDTPPQNPAPRKITPRNIYMSIDFSRGTPSFYEHIISIKNALRKYSNIAQNTYAFDFMLRDNLQDLLNSIEADTGFKELMDVTTLFDGAAPVGAIPEYFRQANTSDYSDSNTLIPHKNEIRLNDDTTMSIITTTNTNQNVSDWITSHTTQQSSVIKNICNAILEQINEPTNVTQDKDILTNRDEHIYMYNFELMLGMFFNARFRYTDFQKNYTSIVDGVKSEIDRLKTSNDSSNKRIRKQSEKAIEASRSDPTIAITTMKNTSIQIIVPRLSNIQQQDPSFNAISILESVSKYVPQSEGATDYKNNIHIAVTNLFKDILDYEKNTSSNNTQESIKLDCALNAFTGALNMSTSNATTGDFITGETVISNGAISDDILSMVKQEQQRIQKVNQVVNIQPKYSANIATLTGINRTWSPDDNRRGVLQLDRSSWSEQRPRGNIMGVLPEGQQQSSTGNNLFQNDNQGFDGQATNDISATDQPPNLVMGTPDGSESDQANNFKTPTQSQNLDSGTSDESESDESTNDFPPKRQRTGSNTRGGSKTRRRPLRIVFHRASKKRREVSSISNNPTSRKQHKKKVHRATRRREHM